MALLEVRGLVKRYGRRTVVDGVSFEVNPGEVRGPKNNIRDHARVTGDEVDDPSKNGMA